MTEVGSGRISKVERAGLTFDVFDEGPLDGEPIVLLHGFPERSTCWRYVAPILNGAGYRTLAMDQRGYSPGARPKRRRDYVQSELVDDVVALIDEVGGSAHLVGHDWGANNVWLTAIRHPDKVRTLTAVSVPHPGLFLKSWTRSGQGVKSWYMAFFQLPVVPEALAGSRMFQGWARRGGLDDEAVHRFRREIVDDGALTTAINWYRALPLTDPRAVGGKVTVPSTLVWSDGDLFIGRWAVDRTETVVDAPYRLVVLPGVSHWIPTQAPDELADAILGRVSGKDA
jgi:pimeloyl-ACP methyl ester carboxylesterase